MEFLRGFISGFWVVSKQFCPELKLVWGRKRLILADRWKNNVFGPFWVNLEICISNLWNKYLWTKLTQPQIGLLGNWPAHFHEIHKIWSKIFPSFSIQVLGPKRANYRSTSAKTNHLRRNLTKKAPYRFSGAKSEPVRLDLKKEFLPFYRTVWGHKKCKFGRSPDLHITITRFGAPFFISGTKTGPQQSQNRLLEQHLNYFAQIPQNGTANGQKYGWIWLSMPLHRSFEPHSSILGARRKTGPKSPETGFKGPNPNYFAQNLSSYHLQNSHFWQFTHN